MYQVTALVGLQIQCPSPGKVTRRDSMPRLLSAVYAPDTGLCTRGPCAGASLYALAVIEEDGVLWFDESQS